MATETTTAEASTSSPPKITVIDRVFNIPLVHDSLTSIHSTLAANALTRTPYAVAQAVGGKAYAVSEPIQVRLAPVITRADGLANSAIDVVESRYPYPFKTPTGDIYGDIKKNSDYAYGVANNTIDDRVRKPAYGIAQGIDQTFTPVVDRFEVVVNKFHGKTCEAAEGVPGPDVPSVDAPKNTFQYQRAYRLSMDLKDHLYVYSSDQVRQLQQHNVIVQRATATAYSITNALRSSLTATSTRVHTLSDAMLAELAQLQASAAALPAHAQAGLHGLSDHVGVAITEMRGVLRGDAPVKDKLAQLVQIVEQQVQPLLESASATVNGALKSVRGKGEETRGNAEGAVSDAQAYANEKKGEAQGKAEEVVDAADEKTQDGKSYAAAVVNGNGSAH